MKELAEMFQRTLIITLALLLLFWLGSCKKEVFDPMLTQEFALQSTTNGATYNITVGLPANYDPATKYAALYVLDGEENFDFVSNQCKEISDQLAVPNVLVISIGWGQGRSIDYTPTKISSVTGGGSEFLDFIEMQLIPAITERFSVDTARNSRVILGHSYGGLLGAYAFTTRNQLFGNYMLLSPSLWFDDLLLLQLEKDNRDNNNREQLVFMGIGEAENSGRMQAPFEAFYQSLRDHYPLMQLGKNSEKNLSHVGSKNPNIVKGLKFYFQNK